MPTMYGTNVMTDEETVIMAKAIIQEGTTDPEEIMNDITLIDDLLTLCQGKSLLTRKKGLTKLLIARLDVEAGFQPENCNIS